MADIVSKEKRSQMMAGIKGTNTKPEIRIRKALYAKGWRYRINVKYLPGKPDIVLRKHHAVIMIHGCFWHGHTCHLYKIPSTRRQFWLDKVESNQKRDIVVLDQLLKAGWRVLTVWECAIKGKTRLDFDTLIHKVEQWIASDADNNEIRGKEC